MSNYHARWAAAYSATQGASWHARDAAWRSAWRTVISKGLNVVWSAAWNAGQGASWEASRGAALEAARGASLALIAYDDCAYILAMPPNQVRMLAGLGLPAAILLLPAVIAFEQLTVDTSPGHCYNTV